MTRKSRARIIFITGTDTGVGKTTLTALLLAHLRRTGAHCLALKPFCSGSRADAELLRSLQDRELTLDEINPFFFPEPVAPLASRSHRGITLGHAAAHVRRFSEHCEWLLVEGVGGLLVPLAREFTVLDFVARLNCETLVVARNRLGTLNHTLLTVHVLQSQIGAGTPGPGGRGRPIKVVLMQPRVLDASSASNPRLLAKLLGPVSVLSLPYLGPRCNRPGRILPCAKTLKPELDRILR